MSAKRWRLLVVSLAVGMAVGMIVRSIDATGLGNEGERVGWPQHIRRVMRLLRCGMHDACPRGESKLMMAADSGLVGVETLDGLPVGGGGG